MVKINTKVEKKMDENVVKKESKRGLLAVHGTLIKRKKQINIKIKNRRKKLVKKLT